MGRPITIALETLAVKAFGDMGPNAQLQLIRDRFIAGHENCALRRHLNSIPPETPAAGSGSQGLGHEVGRCPELDETFLYLLPGWSVEKVGANYKMIWPRVAAERLRAGNGD